MIFLRVFSPQIWLCQRLIDNEKLQNKNILLQRVLNQNKTKTKNIKKMFGKRMRSIKIHNKTFDC